MTQTLTASEPDDALLLATIADELEAKGLEVTPLRELSVEIELLERPPGLLRRLTARAQQLALAQWQHFVGELEESREAIALIRAQTRGERELSEAERAAVREQLLDLVRLFPAGLIAAVNSALPVPGTSVLTPWLLVKLGLMPSRWRESHLLAQLERQQQTLTRAGHISEAKRIGEILLHLETEADEREQIRRETALLTHWDANRNGLWDRDELDAYAREVERVRELTATHAVHKRWFFEYDSEVYGAVRLSDIDDISADTGPSCEGWRSLLVCFDGKTGWVALEHVLDR